MEAPLAPSRPRRRLPDRRRKHQPQTLQNDTLSEPHLILSESHRIHFITVMIW